MQVELKTLSLDDNFTHGINADRTIKEVIDSGGAKFINWWKGKAFNLNDEALTYLNDKLK